MKGKLRKNSFLEGAMFAYIAILAAKVMGALYSIPFYDIIGDRGGVIYSCAYNIYSLFLEISTSGIPIAVSIVISEYNAKGMIHSKEKTYSLTLKFISAVSLTCFLVMQIFAKSIGAYFLKDMTQGVTPDEIALGVRAISFCLLIVPFLSLKRGYLQGHKIMAEPSASQVIEQLVRIAVVLAGSYTARKLMGKNTVYGVCTALLGATAGAACAYLYLRIKTKNSREIFFLDADENEAVASNREIAEKVFSYCITIVIISISNSVYSIVDMKMILTGLHNIGYTDMDTQEIASIASTWIPKICRIITALSMGITNSICPHLAQKRTDGKMDDVNATLNQALSAFLLISMPLAAGLILLSSPVYTLFYGESVYGAEILKLATVVNIVGSMAT
ncbi:MAG: oligosaccharide flippase family protein, partial [Clostridia bacterium]|nr:oligosaccharide flippase family protein [Clostridia bacterium]